MYNSNLILLNSPIPFPIFVKKSIYFELFVQIFDWFLHFVCKNWTFSFLFKKCLYETKI